MSARTRDRLTLLAAHAMFCIAAVTFGFVFWENRRHASTLLDWPVYAGIAATFYASLATTYDFVTRQAARTERWFRGLSTVLLALSILLCLAAMALHESDRFSDRHLSAVIAVMVLFVVWDLLARRYYRRRSSFWFDEYSKILAVDLMLLVAFALAVEFASFGSQADGNRAAVQGGLLCILLFMELIFYGYFSFLQARELENADQPMSVDEGYERVAEYYDGGNAVMAVEESHTRGRLRELCRPDAVVLDFGCGTGRYIGDLCQLSRQVIAVERSDAMLRVLGKHVGNCANLRIYQLDIALPQDSIEAGSVDLVVCCLVIDHLNRFQLQAALLQAARVLRPGGRIYITDVNGYYQLLKKEHAQFVDSNGRLRTIRVYPHTIPEVMDALKKAGFDVEIREETIGGTTAEPGDTLQAIAGFPLITEYLGTRCGGGNRQQTSGG